MRQYCLSVCVYVFLHDKSARLHGFYDDDLEAPWSAIDFGSKRSKVKVAWLECV